MDHHFTSFDRFLRGSCVPEFMVDCGVNMTGSNDREEYNEL